MSKRTKRQQTRKQAKASLANREKLPLIEHIYELRRRLFYVAACVAVGSGIAYGFEHQIVDLLLHPSHGQEFIYTSPIGGMNFLFSVCLDIGLVLATPVIIYQFLAFLQPIMRGTSRKFLLGASTTAGIVALCGVVFGYFIGLPSALHFLLHQFTTVQVKPLITIQSYMSFVALYLFGSALMFQLPLILLIINRIKPIKPSMLFKYERHLIVAAFLIAFIMNPTPNVIDQMLVVIPIIVMYQIGIALIWFVNKRAKQTKIQRLLAADRERQAERLSKQLQLMPAPKLMLDPPVQPQLMDIDELIHTGAVAKASQVTVATSLPVVPDTPKQSPVTAPPRPRNYVAAFEQSSRRYVPLRGQLVQ